MFREQSVETNGEWGDAGCSDEVIDATPIEIDRALRRLAKRRAALDVEEARWLRLGEQQNAWSKLGFVHALEYLEHVFGYAPRTACERLRVATELGDLPELESALEAGELSFSVVRERTRVATPETVDRWLSAARGKNLRDVERMVSGHRKGDDPDDRPDPKLVKHGVWLELDAESFALYRQARAMLDDEADAKLDDKEFVATMARSLLSGERGSNLSEVRGVGDACDGGKRSITKPARMIHLSVCPECKRGWQHGAGVSVELEPAAIERAQCDAIIVDDEHGKRARSAIPPTTRRRVFERDRYRCQVPGCRSARNLEVHHVLALSLGGDHSRANLTTLCDGHHAHHHKGSLVITGQAPDALVFVRNGERLGGAPQPMPRPAEAHRRAESPTVEHVADAQAALRQMGYKPAIAKRAVERACAHVGAGAELVALIVESLKQCG